MHEYGWSFYEIKKLTRPQLLLFQRKANARKMQRDEFEAKLHGFKLKKNGLDTSGCVPIEEVLSSNGGLTL